MLYTINIFILTLSQSGISRNYFAEASVCNSLTGCRGVPGRTTLPGARSSALYRQARLCDVTGVFRGGDTGRRYVKRNEGNAVFDR